VERRAISSSILRGMTMKEKEETPVALKLVAVKRRKVKKKTPRQKMTMGKPEERLLMLS
jgi:hypothetical protein